MCIHTGAVQRTRDPAVRVLDRYSAIIDQLKGIIATMHGGQVLCSSATFAQVRGVGDLRPSCSVTLTQESLSRVLALHAAVTALHLRWFVAIICVGGSSADPQPLLK